MLAERLTGIPASGPLRTFHSAFLVSRLGDWAYMVALNWAVLQATNSAWLLGVINACRLVPPLLLTVVGGVLADRCERRAWLARTYLGMAVTSLLVAILVAIHAPFSALCLGVALQACFAAFEGPLRNRYLADLTTHQRLPRTLTLNSTTTNLASVIGPTAAGLALSTLHAPVTLLTAGLLMLVVPVALARLPKGFVLPAKGQDIQEIGECLSESEKLRALLALGLLPLVFGCAYTSMMPLVSRDLLGLGPQGLGLMLSCAALGCLAATVLLNRGTGRFENGRFVVVSAGLFGLSLVALMFAKSLLTALPILFLVGACGQAYRTIVRVMLQTAAPAALQGRIVSLVLLDRGLITPGSLLVGWVAGWAGPMAGGLVMGGGTLLSVAALVMLFPSLWKLGKTRRRWMPKGDGFVLRPIDPATLPAVVAFTDREYSVKPALAHWN